MTSFSLTSRLRYRFDNVMARGVSAQIGLLTLLTAIIIVFGTVAVFITSTQHSGGFAPTLWTSLLHVVDNGNISADTGSKWYIFVMMIVTLAGLTILAALFGIITNGIDARMETLRRGHSRVVETNHTLILGWSPQIFQILSELMIANENQRKSCIVVLSAVDKPDMEEEIRSRVTKRGRTRIVCRSGDPLDLTDLEIANPQAARSIIVLPPNSSDPDTHVVKTLLAITNHPHRRAEPYHIVAPIRDPKNLEVARIAGGSEGQLILADDLISRITVQTCRQAGLSVVYTELLDFDGDEIYFQSSPQLTGKTFGDALFAYEDSSIIGIQARDGKTWLNPPMETVFNEGDKVIAISKDDDTIVPSGRTEFGIEIDAIQSMPPSNPIPERTLIFNWNDHTSTILTELDSYVSPGSTATVVVRDASTAGHVEALQSVLSNVHVEVFIGDSTDRATLDRQNVGTYDHVIVLAESDTLGPQEADARTLTTLLHLRSINEGLGTHFSVVSEMADVRNRELASATRADDFIVSDQMVSLMLSQLSENKDLQPIFEDLFDPEGSEIYLKPAEYYVTLDRPLNFYTVLESARQRGEVAIGYRMHGHAEDPAAQYGVRVNPPKSASINFTSGDRIIVLAEN